MEPVSSFMPIIHYQNNEWPATNPYDSLNTCFMQACRCLEAHYWTRKNSRIDFQFSFHDWAKLGKTSALSESTLRMPPPTNDADEANHTPPLK